MTGAPQAAIAIMVQGDKVLLGKRTAYKPDYALCWDYIGGRVESGETPLETLHREMDEELGVRPTAVQFLQEYVDRQLNPDDPPTYHFYVVTAWEGGQPRVANAEHSQVGWFTVAALRDLPELADRAYPELAARAVAQSPKGHNTA